MQKLTLESSYAEDRSQIEDLQARYLFAMDFDDIDLFVSMFTKDAVFVVKGDNGTLRGHDAIRKSTMEKYEQDKAQFAKDPLYKVHPPRCHHSVSNMVIKIEGDKAVGRSYWYAVGNNNPERSAVYRSYGHYEDEFVKVNGKWLFSYRKIVYENRDELFHKGGNPAW